MSESSDTKTARIFRGYLTLLGEPAWVIFAFFFVAAVVFGGLIVAVPGLEPLVSTTLGQLLSAALIYVLVVIAVVLPVLIVRKRDYVTKLLGMAKKPGWNILWLPFVIWLAYMGVTIVAAMGAQFLPWVDGDQAQEVGFDGISLPVEYILAFIALVVIPPIAEELLFRGYLFGRLRERFGFWVTAIVTSLTFGFVHLQWNVGIDTFVLSIFLCYLRETTGSIWASMVLHAIKNGIAYFLLFIAPLMGWQLLQ
ncbi:MAG TPA: type II CAAX endopeptidase family protein [Candidatus Saccharibacteria bacterium]|nr:type II CAAX endopeptidase family protein [Candidatus Saccharibacteria bacterium]